MTMVMMPSASPDLKLRVLLEGCSVHDVVAEESHRVDGGVDGEQLE